MGAGWISADESTSGNCALLNWPSSTRAELAAILLVLLTIPTGANIIIYTDSQAVIDGINQMIHWKSRWRWHKTSNASIKMGILVCIKYKNLRLNLVKVKGHSNDRLNDKA